MYYTTKIWIFFTCFSHAFFIFNYWNFDIGMIILSSWIKMLINIRHCIEKANMQRVVACRLVPLSIMGLVYARRWEKRDWKVVGWWVKRKRTNSCFGFLIYLPKNLSHQISLVGITIPVKSYKGSINIGRLIGPS